MGLETCFLDFVLAFDTDVGDHLGKVIKPMFLTLKSCGEGWWGGGSGGGARLGEGGG